METGNMSYPSITKDICTKAKELFILKESNGMRKDGCSEEEIKDKVADFSKHVNIAFSMMFFEQDSVARLSAYYDEDFSSHVCTCYMNHDIHDSIDELQYVVEELFKEESKKNDHSGEVIEFGGRKYRLELVE